MDSQSNARAYVTNSDDRRGSVGLVDGRSDVGKMAAFAIGGAALMAAAMWFGKRWI